MIKYSFSHNVKASQKYNYQIIGAFVGRIHGDCVHFRFLLQKLSPEQEWKEEKNI